MSLFTPNDVLFKEERDMRHISVPSRNELPIRGMDARSLMTHPQSTRVLPEKVAELMLDECMRNPPTKEELEEEAANPRPSERVPEIRSEEPGARFITRRRQYDAILKASYKQQVILMIGQTWSLWHSTPWFDGLATEKDAPSLLCKADHDSATTEFLKDMYETTCFPSFYILKDGKLLLTIEHEEQDAVEAWARKPADADEPEGWPAKFGYTDDGDAVEDPDEPDMYENWQGITTVGIDDAGVVFDQHGRQIPGAKRPYPNPLLDVFTQ